MTANTTAGRFDAYQMATDRIIALLEKGVKPWAQPWTPAGGAGKAWSGNDGRSYSALNQMLLMAASPLMQKDGVTLAELLEDVRGEWLTFKQAIDRGGSVRKGEKGRKIVFFKMLTRTDDDGAPMLDENGEELKVPYLTAYTVFHLRQIDGVEQRYRKPNGAESFPTFTADATAEDVAAAYITREGISLVHTLGDKAYYQPGTDTVVMPLPQQFKSPAEYYSTLFHELTHSTGHKDRLNRIKHTASFGNAEYSTEELVAEIGSASICATLGIETPDSFSNSAAYIASWLKALRNDRKMIVIASAQAEKAIRRILNVAA